MQLALLWCICANPEELYSLGNCGKLMGAIWDKSNFGSTNKKSQVDLAFFMVAC
jgi:hypothetical protein